MTGFRPSLLFTVLDEERLRRRLSWAAMEQEIGVSSGTMKRLRTHATFELDGILFVTQWLGREIEDFAGRLAAGAVEGGRHPFRRFDPPALFAALDGERRQRALDWPQVARNVGQRPGTLERLRGYRRFTVSEVLPVTGWLGRRVLEFTRIGPPPEAMRR